MGLNTMSLFYLPGELNTIRNLIINGRLHITYTNLIFYSDLDSCLLEQSDVSENRFVLAVDIPSANESLYRYQHQPEPDIALTSFNPAWIQRVIVYDDLGHAILLSLFKEGELNLPIENYSDTLANVLADDAMLEDASAHVLPVNSLQQSSNLAAATLFRPQAQAVRNVDHLSSASTSVFSVADVERISTYSAHVTLLQTAFRTARRSILLTSYSMEKRLFNDANLWVLLPEAHRRGVRIYLYINDQKYVDEAIIHFLDVHAVQGDSMYTHSKILAVDNNWVAVGSFNWLSAVAGNYAPNEEATLLYRGRQCLALLETIWTYIRFYRNIQFENEWRVDQFVSNPHNELAKSYVIDDYSTLQYLPTLIAHRRFLQSILNRSPSRVIICSPFISSTGQFRVDINPHLLHRAVQQQVTIFFVCLANSPYIEHMERYLTQINQPQHLFLIRMANLHQKTIIVDGDDVQSLLAEGSFNWLSATRNEESDYHNHEVTLVIQGKKAKPLIQHFYNTPVGIEVLNNINARSLHTSNLPHLF